MGFPHVPLNASCIVSGPGFSIRGPKCDEGSTHFLCLVLTWSRVAHPDRRGRMGDWLENRLVLVLRGAGPRRKFCGELFQVMIVRLKEPEASELWNIGKVTVQVKIRRNSRRDRTELESRFSVD